MQKSKLVHFYLQLLNKIIFFIFEIFNYLYTLSEILISKYCTRTIKFFYFRLIDYLKEGRGSAIISNRKSQESRVIYIYWKNSSSEPKWPNNLWRVAKCWHCSKLWKASSVLSEIIYRMQSFFTKSIFFEQNFAISPWLLGHFFSELLFYK